jgi:hypothetical protein
LTVTITTPVPMIPAMFLKVVSILRSIAMTTMLVPMTLAIPKLVV